MKDIPLVKTQTEKAPISAVIYDYRSDSELNPDFIIYYLHGQGGNERSWESTMDSYIDLFVQNNIIVISPTVGPEGMYIPNHNDKSKDYGSLLINEFIPAVEEENGWIDHKRILMGFSMGGTSASYLFFNNPGFFFTALLISSGIYPIPFNSEDNAIADFFNKYSHYTLKERVIVLLKGNEEYLKKVKYVLSIQRRYIESKEDWEQYNILNSIMPAKGKLVYISCGKYDSLGFYQGNKLMAEEAMNKEYSVSWKSLKGGHGITDHESVISFFNDIFK